ncbi:MAG: hypothetical protein AB8B92_09715 [Gammaproteobacteria bacterium]
MRYFIRFFVILIIVLLLIEGCQRNEEDKDLSENKRSIDHGYYESKRIQKLYLEKLTNEEIPFKIVGDGFIRVPVENLAEFLDFKRKFHNEYVLKPNQIDRLDFESFTIKGEHDDCERKKNKYIEGLDRIGVQHMLDTDERTPCYWGVRYEAINGLKVDKLRQEIELVE